MKYRFYHMKKWIPILLSGILLTSMTGCSTKEQEVEIVTSPASEEVSEEEKGEMILNKLEELEEQVVTFLNSEDFEKGKDKAAEISFAVIDFIFYDKEINGLRFRDIPEKIKYQVVRIGQNIDQMIEAKYPDYKNEIKEQAKETGTTISDQYHNLTEYLEGKLEEQVGTEKVEELKTYCEKASQKARDGLNFIIEKGSDAYDHLEEQYGDDVRGAYTKMKEYAKEKVGNLSNWYQNKKEEYGKE